MDIIQTFAALLQFCYIARRNVVTEASLQELDEVLQRFHKYRAVFSGTVRPDGLAGFSLPRQHSMVHYHNNIKNFGAPNSLCSSITELKHIAAVKRPWCRSSRYKALSQILKVNERLDKLAAAKANFTNRGMLTSPVLVTPTPNMSSDSSDSGGGDSDDNEEVNNGDNNDDEDDNNHNNNDNDNDNDNGNNNNNDTGNNYDGTGLVESEPLMNEVQLAQSQGKFYSIDMPVCC